MVIVCPRCLKAEDEFKLKPDNKLKRWDSELVPVTCQLCDYSFMVKCEAYYRPSESINPLQFLKANSIHIPNHVKRDMLFYLMDEAFEAIVDEKDIPEPTTVTDCNKFNDAFKFYEVAVLPVLLNKYKLQTL